MSETIAIVGDGIAGPATSRRLAEEGIPSTLVVLEDISGGQPPIDFAHRHIAPLVRESVAQELGIDSPFDVPITDARVYAGKWGLTKVARRLGQLSALGDNHRIAPDARKARAKLLGYAYASPLIDVVQGRVTDVLIEDGGGEGVEPDITRLEIERRGAVEGEERKIEIETSWLFDATGKNAAIATMVERRRPGSIVETVEEQPGAYVGAYVQLEGVKSSSANTVYMGLLPNGSHAVLAPHRTDGSDATHLFFVASHQLVPAAMRAANRDHEKVHGSTHLAAAQRLTEGTIWQGIFDPRRLVAADRNVYYMHPDVGSHASKIGGLSLIGDAQVRVAPVTGAGYRHIAEDIGRIVEYARSSKDLREASQRYNARQGEISRERLNRARRLVKYLGRAKTAASVGVR